MELEPLAIVSALSGEDEKVRNATCSRLAEMREEAVGPLLDAWRILYKSISDPESERQVARNFQAIHKIKEILGKLGPRIVPSIAEYTARHGYDHETAEIAASYGESVQEHLARLLESENVSLRRFAIGALSRQGSGAASKLLCVVRDSDRDVRREAISGLLLSAPPDTWLPFLKDFLSDPEPVIRMTTLERLMGSPGVAVRFLNELSSLLADRFVYKVVLDVMVGLGANARMLVPEMVKALAHEDRLEVQRFSEPLRRMDDPTVVLDFLKALAHPQERIRQKAAELLRDFASRDTADMEVIPTLRRSLDSTDAETVILALLAVEALGALAEPLVPDIERLESHRSKVVREQARQQLRNLGAV